MDADKTTLQFFASGYTPSANDPGVFKFEFDPASKHVNRIDASAGVPDPSYVELVRRFVYAASESKTCGRLSSYRLDVQDVLDYRESCEFPGEEETCFVLVKPDRKCLYGANYASGSICAVALNPDGSFGKPFPLIKHEGHGFKRSKDDPNFGRQDTPHVHTLSYVPGTEYLAAVDLGLDAIFIYRTEDDGQIDPMPVAVIGAPKGTGPRIIAYHPSLSTAAVVCELSCELLLYKMSEDGLVWDFIDRLDLLAEASSRRLSTTPPLAAHAEFSKDGRFLYVSTRGVDLITIFEFDKNGNVVGRHDQPCGGRSPRHFALSPDNEFLGVANQLDDSVTIFKRDTHTGRLSEVAKAECTQPSCVAWVAASEN